MHGYRPGEVQPTTELMTEHKHPDDRDSFTALVERMRATRTHFSSRHRIIDKHGRVRTVIVLGRTFRAADGSVVGTEGFYVDPGVDPAADSGTGEDEAVRGRVAAHVQHFRETGAVIEQAKGMLMVVYGVDEERAFEVLRWLSQTRNIPVREISRALVASAAGTQMPPDAQRAFDAVVLGDSHVPEDAQADDAAGDSVAGR